MNLSHVLAPPLTVVALTGAFLAAGAIPARAWTCAPGYADTLENQRAGYCVEQGTPVPTATPVPPTPTLVTTWTALPTSTLPVATVTAGPATSPTPPEFPALPPTPMNTATVPLIETVAPFPVAPTAAPSAPLANAASDSAPSGGSRLTAYCVYEPTTGNYEQRRTTDVLRALAASLDTAHPNLPMPTEGVCNQPTPLPVATPVRTASRAPMVSATPSPPAVPQPAPASTGAPTTAPTIISISTPTPLPLIVEPLCVEQGGPVPSCEGFPQMPETPVTVSDDMPPVQIPNALPATGDGTTYEED